jgi:hypothetical protein
VSDYTHVRTAAYVLRPGMPAKFHAPMFRKSWKDSGEVEGIVTRVVKTGPTQLRVILTDRYSGRIRVRSVDHRHAVYLHKGYLQEHGIKLGAAEDDRAGFLAAVKGASF